MNRLNLIIHFFPLVALLGYGVATIIYSNAVLTSNSKMLSTGRKTLLVSLLFHLMFEFSEIVLSDVDFIDQGLRFAGTLSAISCILIAVFALLSGYKKFNSLGLFISPLAFVLMLISGVFFHFAPETKQVIEQSLLIQLHIGFVIVAHVFFAFSFVSSCAILLQVHMLKTRRFSKFQNWLPALRTLDDTNAVTVYGGLSLMSVGIILGFTYLTRQESLNSLLDPRLFFSVVTILLYGLLALAMGRYGLRGKRAAIAAIVGFGFILLSFVGNIEISSFHVY